MVVITGKFGTQSGNPTNIGAEAGEQTARELGQFLEKYARSPAQSQSDFDNLCHHVFGTLRGATLNEDQLNGIYDTLQKSADLPKSVGEQALRYLQISTTFATGSSSEASKRIAADADDTAWHMLRGKWRFFEVPVEALEYLASDNSIQRLAPTQKTTLNEVLGKIVSAFVKTDGSNLKIADRLMKVVDKLDSSAEGAVNMTRASLKRYMSAHGEGAATDLGPQDTPQP